MTDLRANLGAARLASEQRRHRHVWHPNDDGDMCPNCVTPWKCNGPHEGPRRGYRQECACGAVKDEQKSRRGRTSRRRGNDYERDIARRVGGTRVGMYGGKPDVQADWIVIQAKNGGAFPERIWRWLEELPHDHRLRAVVIGDAPGPGHDRREVIVMDFTDFIEWFGHG